MANRLQTQHKIRNAYYYSKTIIPIDSVINTQQNIARYLFIN